MEILRLLVLSLHFIGLAALVGLREMQDLPVNQTKIAVKLTIALIAAVAAFLAHRRQAKDGKVMPLFHTAGGLGLVNILIAVLW